ncbi:MAG: DUF1592 domain-containing protein [Myxococcota bacterium]|nr:DUF1592 domain-containing protein [Myxococcota bacterium]
MRSLALASAIALTSCTGVIGDGLEGSEPAPYSGPIFGDARALGPSTMRRLSRAEYAAAVTVVTGESPTAAELATLPADSVSPFDNDLTGQAPSAALVEAVRSLAAAITERVFADPGKRAAILGCAPTGPNDTSCLRQFIAQRGRLALRRPLTSDEIDAYAGTVGLAMDANDFSVAARVVLQAFLQDMELLYRIELGTPTSQDANVIALGPFEIAARLSFTLWGAPPDDALLDAAASGVLDSQQGLRDTATAMLGDERAIARVSRFHAMWLGYEDMPHAPEQAAVFRRETDTLVRRVVFDERASWLDLFRAEETFIDDKLAVHYGLASTGEAQATWRSYEATGRRGLLSHASVLSNGGSGGGDTSVIRRGLFVRNRLLCDEIPPPPPELDVNVDQPPAPGPNDCKQDVIARHSTDAACSACHALIDPIGRGLERFDLAGRFRTHEPGKDFCPLDGVGSLDSQGQFEGPAGLADLLLESELLDACVVEQVLRFTAGRKTMRADKERLAETVSWWRGAGLQLDTLLVEIVASPAFRHRVIAAEDQVWR